MDELLDKSSVWTCTYNHHKHPQWGALQPSWWQVVTSSLHSHLWWIPPKIKGRLNTSKPFELIPALWQRDYWNKCYYAVKTEKKPTLKGLSRFIFRVLAIKRNNYIWFKITYYKRHCRDKQETMNMDGMLDIIRSVNFLR